MIENVPAAEDWPDVGSVGVFPVLVEHVVAEHWWAADPDGTRWVGGKNPGWDVTGGRGRVDAKTAWIDKQRLCFAAPAGGFNANRVDFVAPVILHASTITHAVTGLGGRLVATYADADLWVIPVVAVNALLRWPGQGRSSVSLSDVGCWRKRTASTTDL